MRDTIEMAREAGLDITCDPTETPWRTFVEGWEDQLKAFEALVRADEREGIAEMFDAPMRLIPFVQNTQGGCVICGFTPSLAAAAIRARGETK
jgi:hypothetical protein